MSTEPLSLLTEPIPPGPSRWPAIIVILLAVIAVLCGGGAVVLARLGRPYIATPFTSRAPAVAEADPLRLVRRAAAAEREIDRVGPKGVYIVVDTYRNRLRLVDHGKPIREAVCSTGTGVVLRDPRNGRQWVFDTPMGERIVERKVTHPVWAKPDWAFIEEGYLPPKDPNERFDNQSLGDYALYIGDGFIIHGTLFKSLLGRRVTHGCIRLGDDDLEFLYHHAPIGTHVYLY